MHKKKTQYRIGRVKNNEKKNLCGVGLLVRDTGVYFTACVG